MRNEELYIPVLEYLVASPNARIEDKVRAEYWLFTLMQTWMNGKKHSMKSLLNGLTGIALMEWLWKKNFMT